MQPKPAPYPADTKAKGWRFELDLEQVMQSDTWALAAADVRPWLLMLWTVAWQQVPCGSMANDDAVIAAKLGMSPKLFAKHRDVLMRGWWLADDGRYYHSTITDRVQAMLNIKQKEKDRKAAYRQARQAAEAATGQPQDVQGSPEMSHGTTTGQPQDGHVTDMGKTTPEPEPEPEPTTFINTPLPPTGGAARFDAFWQAYPKKVGKDVAKRAFDKRKVDDDLLAEILKAVKLQAASPQWAKDGGQFIPNPATWLNGGRWQDEVQSAGDVVQADDSRPDWAVNAGFANVWEANNEGCFRHNAAQFANGRRKECRQNALKTAQAAKTDSGQWVDSVYGGKSLKTPVIGGGVAT